MANAGGVGVHLLTRSPKASGAGGGWNPEGGGAPLVGAKVLRRRRVLDYLCTSDTSGVT